MLFENMKKEKIKKKVLELKKFIVKFALILY